MPRLHIWPSFRSLLSVPRKIKVKVARSVIACDANVLAPLMAIFRGSR